MAEITRRQQILEAYQLRLRSGGVYGAEADVARELDVSLQYVHRIIHESGVNHRKNKVNDDVRRYGELVAQLILRDGLQANVIATKIGWGRNRLLRMLGAMAKHSDRGRRALAEVVSRRRGGRGNAAPVAGGNLMGATDCGMESQRLLVEIAKEEVRLSALRVVSCIVVLGRTPSELSRQITTFGGDTPAIPIKRIYEYLALRSTPTDVELHALAKAMKLPMPWVMRGVPSEGLPWMLISGPLASAIHDTTSLVKQYIAFLREASKQADADLDHIHQVSVQRDKDDVLRLSANPLAAQRLALVKSEAEERRHRRADQARQFSEQINAARKSVIQAARAGFVDWASTILRRLTNTKEVRRAKALLEELVIQNAEHQNKAEWCPPLGSLRARLAASLAPFQTTSLLPTAV